MASESCRRTGNRLAAVIVPAALIGTAGYSIYVYVYEFSIQYLIPGRQAKFLGQQPVQKRHAAAIALIVVYWVLFALTWLPYFRFLYTVYFNDGSIPKGVRPVSRSKSRSQRRSHSRSSPDYRSSSGTRNGTTTYRPVDRLDREALLAGTVRSPQGLIEYITSKDVYCSDHHGLPNFCDKCWAWKPNRTHHCSDIGRCVRRMDHFCPWVGGVVSETNHKFFIQFTVYAFLFCGLVVGSLGWALADQRAHAQDLNGNFIALVAIAALFALFALGMSGNSIQLAMKNETTVEHMFKGPQYLAILVPSVAPNPPNIAHYKTIEYPTGPPGQSIPRVFAIVQTRSGDNPWDLGSPLANLKTVMGDKYAEWILPIKYSPCVREERFGPVIKRLKKDWGLEEPLRRRRRSRSHSQHPVDSRGRDVEEVNGRIS